jgi:hypothetical protein
MPSMTEELGRIAGGIAAGRRDRREAAVERRREAGSRHRAVGQELHEIRRARQKMSREQRRGAAAGKHKRESEVAVLLQQFRRDRETLHRHQLEAAAAERVRAAVFMRDLTGRVAALRDAFAASQIVRAKSCDDLAKALHGQLASYRRDRHDAGAAWRGMPGRHAAPSASGSRAGRQRAPHEDRASP